MRRSSNPVTPSWLLRLIVATLLVGVGSGLSGLVVAAGLHMIQYLAYGYSGGTFLEGLLHSPPWTRAVAMTAAGIVGGIGWWALRRWGRAFVSVEASVAGHRMPAVVTLINAALQIVIVGLGASIGREVAPRELGAWLAGWFSEIVGLSARERRILVASGAGAGLAAVYNVPLGGAVFAIEILLSEISFATVLPALATSAIGTLVARIIVPSTPLYAVPKFDLSPSLLVWSVLAGPVFGLAAIGFVKIARFAEAHRPKSWGILVVMPVVFAAVGVIGVALPAVLGNGRSLGQIAFEATIPLGVIAVTLVAKVFATVGTIGSGAAGGTLTPSLAIGAALGAVTGGVWGLLWPGVPPAAFAVMGAAAFLASSMRAPLTALILVLEFTNEGPAMLVPMMLTVAGSVAVGYIMGRGGITGVG